jgi:hypothetical protein
VLPSWIPSNELKNWPFGSKNKKFSSSGAILDFNALELSRQDLEC